jgi:hypothetical protein
VLSNSFKQGRPEANNSLSQKSTQKQGKKTTKKQKKPASGHCPISDHQPTRHIVSIAEEDQ